MSWLAEWGLAAAAMVGHFSLAVWLFNRLHAVGWPRPVVKVLDKLIILVAALVLVWLAVRGPGWLFYAVICWPAALLAVPMWLVPKFRHAATPDLRANDTIVVNVAERLGFRPLHGLRATWMGLLPGNEILQIAVQKKCLAVTNLPEKLSGLKIAHLSDLHMTGQLGKEFYDCVVDLTNDWEPDVVVITGDILEKDRCLPWVLPTLGRLKAPEGKFFVLGNHEMRLRDVAPLRKLLAEANFRDLGSRAERVTIRGTECILAGSELPWFGKEPPLEPRSGAALRILLSHSPDQLAWARSHGFDVMLAGHTHGGQIRLPLVGALISPSWHGFRYAGGIYHEPPTLLHVSRGLAGIHPIRWNCPPELALLTLVAA